MTTSRYTALCTALLLLAPVFGSHAATIEAATAPRANVSATAAGYFEEFNHAACNNNNDECAVRFSVVPAGKTLVVSHVGCRLFLSPVVPVFSYILTDTRRVGRDMPLTPILLGQNNISGFFNSSNPVTKLYREGERPQVYVGLLANPGEIVMDCIITGQLR